MTGHQDLGVRESLAYDEANGVYRADFSRSRTPASEAVVVALGEITDRTPAELDPLYETIDPGGLDSVLTARGPEGSNGTTAVTFTYHDHEVTVTDSGRLTVRPLPDGGPFGDR